MGEARRKKLVAAAGEVPAPVDVDVRIRDALARYEIRRTEYRVQTQTGRQVTLYRCGAVLFVRTEDVAPEEVTPQDRLRPWTRPDGTLVTLHEVRAAVTHARRGAP